MRSLLIGFALLVAHPAYAQLAPHNAAGVTFGHVHLTVVDPKVHHQLWVDQFGGVVSTKGKFTVVRMPNMMIAFRAAPSPPAARKPQRSTTSASKCRVWPTR